MKTHSFTHVMILLVGAAMLLTSCEYPYYYNNGYYGAGMNPRSGTVYGALAGAGLGAIVGNQSRRPLEGALIGGVLGGMAGSALSGNRYYTVRSNPVYGRPYYSRSHYYGRPYYSTSRYYCPPYRYSPFYSSYNYRPWGGYYGRSFPYNGWGTTGLGFGTSWF